MRLFVILSVLFAVTYGSAIRKPVVDFSNRIIDGDLADIKDFPHQVALLKNGRQSCGGSIISPLWSLTAAHCTHQVQVEVLSLRAGSSVWNEGGTVHQVIRNIWHPLYNLTAPIDYDFAVLKVSIEFPIGTPGVAIIALAAVAPSGGEMAVVSGWGRTEYKVIELRNVSLPVINHDVCRTYFEGNSWYITDRMMCAGWPVGAGGNTCNGDSGGALLVNGRQVGIVSWGIDCGMTGYPKVFGNVADQNAWIRKMAELD